MSRPLLITGATGKQGRAVIEALVRNKNSGFSPILALTRNPNSASAQRLTSLSPSIKLVQGDLDNVPAVFAETQKAIPSTPLWGVFSVQTVGKNEVQQGKSLIDEALKAGVKHFVYSSVDRGGNEHSWKNPTNIPHFRTKHEIELYLRDSTAKAGGKNEMGWTILRPVIFFDNLSPGFGAKLFITTLKDTMGDKPMPWVATADIGIFAAKAFEEPDAWNKKAVGLAGDEFTLSHFETVFEKVTGSPIGRTFGFLGTALKYGMREMGIMINWFRDEGYQVDVAELRKIHPEMLDLEGWLRQSSFPKVSR